jgi:RHS repeat-associated protein
MSAISMIRHASLTCRALCLTLLFLMSMGLFSKSAHAGSWQLSVYLTSDVYISGPVNGYPPYTPQTQKWAYHQAPPYTAQAVLNPDSSGNAKGTAITQGRGYVSASWTRSYPGEALPAQVTLSVASQTTIFADSPLDGSTFNISSMQANNGFDDPVVIYYDYNGQGLRHQAWYSGGTHIVRVSTAGGTTDSTTGVYTVKLPMSVGMDASIKANINGTNSNSTPAQIMADLRDLSIGLSSAEPNTTAPQHPPFLPPPPDSPPPPTPTPPSGSRNKMPPWGRSDPNSPKNPCPPNVGEGALDAGCPVEDSGPSAGDPVNLSDGSEAYYPASDLKTYNPNGQGANWQRSFSSLQSANGYGTPGLARGWVSNYDVVVTEPASNSWDVLTLRYPDGSAEDWTPRLNSSNQPTGIFGTTKNPPYVVSGTASSTVGLWSNLVVNWKTGTKWVFKPLSGTAYVLDRIVDPLGHAISFAWDSSRRLTSVTDVTSGGALMTLTYNTVGKLASVQDVYGRQIVYTFGTPASGNYADTELTQVSQLVATGTANPPMRYSFDYTGFTANNTTSPLLTSISVPSPTGSSLATATLAYSGNHVISHTDGNGNVFAYTYNANTSTGGSTLVQYKDPLGNVVLSYTQNFDLQGRNTGTTDSAGKSTLIKYEDANNFYQATSVSDEMGRTSMMTYDGFGNVLTSISPRNIRTTYTYDSANSGIGRLVQVQEGSKPAVSMSYYEPAGLPQNVTAIGPTGSGTVSGSATYDALGNVLTVTTPGNDATQNKTTTFNYTQDGSYSQAARVGQPLTVTDNAGNVTHFRYDARGNVIQSWDALGNTTDITYNIADQVTDTLAPATGQNGSGRTHLIAGYLYLRGPQTSTRLYDESGALLRTVNTIYGPEGETLGTSGDTLPSSVSYDALYRTKTLRDSNGNVTSYFYNLLGQLSQIAYPGADSSGKDTLNYTSYDASGLLLQSVDGRGRTTNYTYNDPEGQLTNISYPYSSSENVSYAYDAYGLPQSVTDGTGTRSYTLNAADVVTQVSTIFKRLDGTLSSAKNISYTYNADGSRATMTTPAGSSAYAHDTLGRWTGLQDHQGGMWRWNYDALSRMTRQTMSNGAYTNYTYNALSQLVGLANLDSGGGDLSKFGHNTDASQMLLYDGVGNLKRETAAYNIYSSSRFFAGTTNYSYDNKDQLTQESSTRNSGFGNVFGYDAVGNPTSWKGQARTFNGNNQETTGGTSQFNYDGNGNPTTYKGNGATFNENDKLTRLANPGGTVLLQAGYRSDGLRAWKNTGTDTTYFLYDGSQLVCEFYGDANTLSTINVWGANGLLGRQRGTNTGTPIDCYVWDDRGNIAQVLNPNGSVAVNFNVTAWGDVTRDQSWSGPYFGLGGQWGNYLDVETGLTLCGQRYYDASAGRWLTRDPISYAGGLNVYGYVGNNPVNFVDPAGMNRLTDAYMGGMGGFSGWMDKHLMGGATENLGNVTGQYDSGCATGWDVAKAGGRWGFQAGVVATTAVSGYGLARGGIAAIAGAGGEGAVTVGRWMSAAEHEAMESSGMVQESLSGTTHVASPADPSAFIRQAAKGSRYVEFDVPASALKQTQQGWAKIIGPNSLEGRLATLKGLPLPQMPAASNITHLADKLPW